MSARWTPNRMCARRRNVRALMARDLHTARSLLFVPASDRRKLRRALSSEADAVVADLEDAVAATEKANARGQLADAFADTDTDAARLVRVNEVGSEYFEDDLSAVDSLPLDGIVLPKATPDAVRNLGIRTLPIVAIVETAQG